MKAGILLIIAVAVVSGDELAREIWDQNFRSKRPAAPGGGSAQKPAVRYGRPDASPTSKPAVVPSGKPVVGVTFWRLRAASASDTDTPRLLVPEESGSAPGAAARKGEYVAERLAPGTPIRLGDRLRLGIEAPRDGYLYVIDRERYRDGTRGEPFLIFPSLKFNGGRNAVTPGRLVEIPSQSDATPALRVVQRMEGHVGDDLLIIVSPEPIPNLQPGKGAAPLAPELVERLERDWEAAAERWDLLTAGARTWTASERQAGSETPRLLTPEDPMPQAIYSTSARENAPVLIRIPLEVK